MQGALALARAAALPLVISLALLPGAAQAQQNTFYSSRTERQCVCPGTFNETMDYFPFKVENNYSELWNVTYHKSYKVVRDQVLQRDVYLQLCGTPRPAEAPEDAVIIEIPIRSAAVDSTSMFPSFELIGQRRSLKHYISQNYYVSNPCFQALEELGFVTKSPANASAPGPGESLTRDSGVDVAFRSAFNSGPSAFEEAGSVPIVVFNEAFEPSPLGKSEWTEFLSLFFNREEAAGQIVPRLEERYNCHRARAVALPSTPKVLMFYVSDFGFNPETDSCDMILNASDPASMRYWGTTFRSCPHPDCTFVEDAGAELIRNINQSTLEQLVNDTRDAEVILYTFNFTSLQSHTCFPVVEAWLNQTLAYRNGNVYDIYRTGRIVDGVDATEWFEAKGAEPDVALLDFLSVLNPDALVHNHTRRFLRKALPPGEEARIAPSSDDCSDIDAPLYQSWKEYPCAQNTSIVTIPGLEPLQPGSVSCATTGPSASPTPLSSSLAPTSGPTPGPTPNATAPTPDGRFGGSEDGDGGDSTDDAHLVLGLTLGVTFVLFFLMAGVLYCTRGRAGDNFQHEQVPRGDPSGAPSGAPVSQDAGAGAEAAPVDAKEVTIN